MISKDSSKNKYVEDNVEAFIKQNKTYEEYVAYVKENPECQKTLDVLGIDIRSEEDYPFGDTHPILRTLVDAYTPDHCMWGSDFPCENWLKKATYEEHLAVFADELGLSENEKKAILGDTPGQIWFGDRADRAQYS